MSFDQKSVFFFIFSPAFQSDLSEMKYFGFPSPDPDGDDQGAPEFLMAALRSLTHLYYIMHFLIDMCIPLHVLCP